MDLPHFIFEEILSFLEKEQYSELLTLNKHSSKALLDYVIRNFRISLPMPENFYDVILPKFGKRVRSLEFNFFDKKAARVLPNIEKIKILDNHDECLEDDIGFLLKQYPKLTELDLGELILDFETVLLVCNLKNLISLKIPEFLDELQYVHSFLDDLAIPSLRVLFLNFPEVDKDALNRMSKNNPNLNCLGIVTKYLSKKSIDIFDVSFVNLKSFKFVVKSYHLFESPLLFNLENFPKLIDLCVSTPIVLENKSGKPCPSVEGFMNFHMCRKPTSPVLEHFTGLSSLVLSCERVSTAFIKELLPNLTTLKSLEFRRIRDPVIFMDLPYKKYMAHSFSLISSCPVHPDFFLWISSCFGRLYRLAVDFDPSSSIPCDAIPLKMGQHFHSLSHLYFGGRFPGIWIRQILSQSSKLGILGLDPDLYSKHSNRFTKQYPSLDILSNPRTPIFDGEYSDYDSDNDSDSVLVSDTNSDSGSDSEIEFDSTSDSHYHFGSDSDPTSENDSDA